MGLALRAQQKLQSVTATSPVGGQNAVSPIADMPATDALSLINLLPGPQGAKTRLGSAQHTAGIPEGVRTLIPFTGVDGSHNKLFAVTHIAIYDCTVTGAAPAAVVTFGTSTGLAGYGGYTQVSTLDDHYLAYCDEVNGYYLYTESSNTWEHVVEVSTSATSTYTPPTSSTGTTVTIEGVTFNSDFSTDADTTVNNLIALIVANATINALVTVTLVSHQMLLTAKAAGAFGNGITTVTNGLHGSSWNHAATTGGVGKISGVDPATFVFPCVWGSRLWFVAQNSGLGWYLGFNSVYGPATAYEFGYNFQFGGNVKCLANWTVDGGSGIQNNLAAFSSAGDISVYTGTDPEVANAFILAGNWFVGGFPTGRNISTSSGGDVVIIAAYGLISLAKLLQGVSLVDRSIFETWKVDNLFAQQFTANFNTPGWSISVSPQEQALQVYVPQASGGPPVGFSMSYSTRNWTSIVGRDASYAAAWTNQLYFGDTAGNIWEVTGGLDEVLLDGSAGQPIPFTWFSSFQGFGAPALRKQAMFARPAFLTQGQLSYSIVCRFDYDQTPGPPAPGFVPELGSLWDTAVWDLDVWGGGVTTYEVNQQVVGVNGNGRMVALVVNGLTNGATILTDCTLTFVPGGYW